MDKIVHARGDLLHHSFGRPVYSALCNNRIYISGPIETVTCFECDEAMKARHVISMVKWRG